jgi:hypothetical protein
MIAPSFVISGKVQEPSPGNWETTLPRDVPEFSGDLLVLIATGTSGIGRHSLVASAARAP